MKGAVEAISLAGSTLRVSAPDPLAAERATLAVACALRVFERFSALDGLVLGGGGAGSEVSLGRAEVERLLAPDGFAALRDRNRWPQLLARAVRRYSRQDGDGGA
jgi:hypothetical protein